MNRIHAKLVLAGVLLAMAVGYLAFAGVKSGWVYMVEVDQYLTDPQFHTQRVRLHGSVGTEGFECSPARLTARFELQGESGGVVPVVYSGNIPEMFGTGKSVVVEGRADAAGIFQADVLMTKCASKYEPSSPHAESKP
jgi:cytochrome c-type biogenesis protein CcmE